MPRQRREERARGSQSFFHVLVPYPATKSPLKNTVAKHPRTRCVHLLVVPHPWKPYHLPLVYRLPPRLDHDTMRYDTIARGELAVVDRTTWRGPPAELAPFISSGESLCSHQVRNDITRERTINSEECRAAISDFRCFAVESPAPLHTHTSQNPTSV